MQERREMESCSSLVTVDLHVISGTDRDEASVEYVTTYLTEFVSRCHQSL